MSSIKMRIVNRIQCILVVLLLLTFILPYYAIAAKEKKDEKGRGLVPSVASKVLEGITVVTDAESVTASSNNVVSTNYPKSGFGYDSVTKINGRTYKDYKQYHKDVQAHSYWNSNIGGSGCGPTTIAIIASGYGIDKTPIDIADIIKDKYENITNSEKLSQALNDIGISHERRTSDSKQTAIKNIKENLEKGNPVAAPVLPGPDSKYTYESHWMAILGISGNTITISNPGNDNTTDDLNDFVNKYLDTGYILITQSIDTNTSSSNSSTNINDNSSNTTKDGINIHKSGITGKEFKEYKQNIGDWADDYYATGGGTIGACGCNVTSEAILCSGYGSNLTPRDLNRKYSSYNTGSELASMLGFDNTSRTSFNKEQVVDHLKKGGTLFLHVQNYMGYGEHWMAVIDIKKDGSQVWISNPDSGSSYSGWTNTDVIVGSGVVRNNVCSSRRR